MCCSTDGPELPAEIVLEPAPIRGYIAAELEVIMEDEYFRYLAESAMQPYGTLTVGRADRLGELMANVIDTS
ncbi:MAG TPA: hypothetical protein VGG98_00910 [Solirubrobacteraceae bacterium]